MSVVAWNVRPRFKRQDVEGPTQWVCYCNFAITDRLPWIDERVSGKPVGYYVIVTQDTLDPDTAMRMAAELIEKVVESVGSKVEA